jgi:hypothetical protein
MDALTLTLEPSGWIATPLGPWTDAIGAGGLHVSPGCVHADELLAELAVQVPAHVVITVEYAS